jgi:hypothetical protein
MTFSLITSNITLSVVNVECHVFDIVILSAIMLNVVMRSVFMMSVVVPLDELESELS